MGHRRTGKVQDHCLGLLQRSTGHPLRLRSLRLTQFQGRQEVDVGGRELQPQQRCQDAGGKQVRPGRGEAGEPGVGPEICRERGDDLLLGICEDKVKRVDDVQVIFWVDEDEVFKAIHLKIQNN